MSKYAILDLEMCRMPRGRKKEMFPIKNEIIQIGAVLLDENMETAGDYMSYVHPEYGEIDRFIEDLTGITRENTRTAPVLENALRDFLNAMPEDTIPVSWSDTDLIQIQKEIEVKNIDIPGLSEFMDWCVDCQKTFSEKMHTDKVYKLSEAVLICDIWLDDGEHDALVDARNTAKLFAKMKTEDELVLSPYYSGDTEDDTSSSGLLGYYYK